MFGHLLQRNNNTNSWSKFSKIYMSAKNYNIFLFFGGGRRNIQPLWGPLLDASVRQHILVLQLDKVMSQDDLSSLIRACDEIVWTYSEHSETSIRRTIVEWFPDKLCIPKKNCACYTWGCTGSIYGGTLKVCIILHCLVI